MTLVEQAAIRDESDVAEAIRAASAEGASLSVRGNGSKARLGRHAPAAAVLSLRELSGVTLYEPEELVLTARAGTPLAEIEALIGSHGQQLAFEPMDYGPLLGARAGATIGGVIAVNASGPRRIKAGAARDHLLGFRCVTGRGEIVKSGGRVMKNVTGYDLSKLVTGSYGTLAALTEVTLKVLPKPETEQTLLLRGLSEEQSLAVLRQASGTAYEVSSLAALPAGAAPLGLPGCTAALRLEGPQISVSARREALEKALAGFGGRFEFLPPADSAALWRGLRDAAPVAAQEGQAWRVSVAPTDGFAVVSGLRAAGVAIRAYFYDWAGGLVWLCLEEAPDASATTLREIIDARGGHATLIRASEEVRACVDVFHPQPPALAALTLRVKESFDPAHILERGRMRAEF